MPRKTTGIAVLFVSLLFSLGLNVLFFLEKNSPNPDPARPVTDPMAAQSSPETSDALADCKASLARCRTGFVQPTFSLSGAVNTPVANKEKPTPVPPAINAFDPLPRVDAALQADTLDLIARQHLRQHWESQTDSITNTLLRDLNDPVKLQADMTRDANEFAVLLDLNESEKERFEERYAELHAMRVARVREHMGPESIDYAVLHQELKAYFNDEDQLAADMRGEDARRKLRLARLESRTALLAVAATLAKLPWEENINW